LGGACRDSSGDGPRTGPARPSGHRQRGPSRRAGRGRAAAVPAAELMGQIRCDTIAFQLRRTVTRSERRPLRSSASSPATPMPARPRWRPGSRPLGHRERSSTGSVRDVTYEEDKSLVRIGNAPRVMASLPVACHQPPASGRPRQHRRRQPPPRPQPAAHAQAASSSANDFALSPGRVWPLVYIKAAHAAPRPGVSAGLCRWAAPSEHAEPRADPTDRGWLIRCAHGAASSRLPHAPVVPLAATASRSSCGRRSAMASPT
jgi:hypothetical protein